MLILGVRPWVGDESTVSVRVAKLACKNRRARQLLLRVRGSRSTEDNSPSFQKVLLVPKPYRNAMRTRVFTHIVTEWGVQSTPKSSAGMIRQLRIGRRVRRSKHTVVLVEEVAVDCVRGKRASALAAGKIEKVGLPLYKPCVR